MNKFKVGQQVIVARCPANTPIDWVDGMKVGAVLTVKRLYGDHCFLSDNYYYGNDCLEPYTGKPTPAKTEAPKFTINEPLQPWERF